MSFTNPLRILLVPLVLMAGLTAITPSFAQQGEIDRLKQYVGNWQGSGTMTGGEQPEDFSCRMTIDQGRDETKIRYVGRCSLLNLNLSVRGTIAYNADSRRYEAAMSSNTSFSGIAVGQRRGDAIVFDLRERNMDEEGRDITIGSEIILRNDRVTVEFDVTFNESGDTMRTSVPFNRT